MICDLAQSRRMTKAVRSDVQRRLTALLTQMNVRYQTALVARFAFSAGDEFQGLLDNRSAVEIPNVIWDVEEALPDLRLHLGIGCGEVFTARRPTAPEMDGPAFHHARAAIDAARQEGRSGGVFQGFGATGDTVLNGLARLLYQVRQRMGDRREIIRLLRQGQRQVEVARRLKTSRQNVHIRAGTAGWEAYREGEAALTAALQLFTAQPVSRKHP